ncbi:hypothetical protein Enr10x_37940 [Gimesia panareensis]|uniref:DUF1853 domain-containing protein n=1 Tax=Gimesia panareensis TaxID=2527978 RepID=A0A517Q9Y9_9PLAN|nr:DUF1853 family protein [Gimesia panareensis]QDT28450.1 hypothetical protein Enr10x_37940 [Gimesia panareensis]
MHEDPQFRQSRALRDLQWAIESPTLITDSAADIQPPRLPDFDQIDFRELESFLVPYSRFRIGEYFEGLILYWLERIRGVKIIAQHQQVFENGQTVGEIDFLFEDESGVLTYWETAVKFYLYFPAANRTGSHFVGPNVKDTFEKKIHRLFKHQLPLSQQHYPDVIQRRAMVKGCIFYHPDDEQPGELPARLVPGHAQASWLRCSELSRLLAPAQNPLFLIREKPDWLSPALCSPADPDLLCYDKLQHHLENHFQTSPRPILISVLTE